ncbi:multifunctional oxoglutarate decarboxylase/oxoglutarate dehydrogenase thiamine pyrophosphate-binding subunit/dihydrolipoyllysine-residue succinyltransferase subunit [Ferrimicrobium sp.]|uniref:multifunctional oxoglutarate decarboxylase/oxoglutarate dehydrogenase thiamine pyrophosphate-binding subunit/dihydrolipoyllysine-residue succinyltransferase subunit n=1 Tax=Ferrimicrobium sp. TaxID=2926050 RepID=UPI002628B128|nr:multifunctional oxoglutarate decarboxylase/oxoglutarate dehydrogenase thiamine pyrophosphate-binding subunit/dihydrolipoyllysine-residue succinyltransferase subunit [Ferrimicrobium sp.]
MVDTFETDFGPNDWLVEEMLDHYRDNPESVPASWQQYFKSRNIGPRFANSTVTDAVATEGSTEQAVATHHNNSTQTAASPEPIVNSASDITPAPTVDTTPPATNGNHRPTPPFATPTGTLADGSTSRTSASPPQVVNPVTPTGSDDTTLNPLRGAALALARNMDQSLTLPTATSVRVIPAKALEINRSIINNQLGREGRPKVSFGHLITWAIIKSLAKHPRMNASFVPASDGVEASVRTFTHINLGVAVDIVRRDGQRTLMVPVLKNIESKTFNEFLVAYDQLIAKVRENRATVDDFQGASVSVTNPGTIGTEHSIPRLMNGQGAIIGVGAIGYPVEFGAADPRTLGELGISKTVTLTSTYDHRIIQGAESGQFLADAATLLEGKDGFYHEIFSSLDIAYPPAIWSPDHGSLTGDASERAEKQIHVQTLINNYRVRGHLLAHLDPLNLVKPTMSPELDPETYGLTVWDLSRVFLTDGLAGTTEASLAEILQLLRDSYCGSIGYEYMHIQNPEEKHWIQNRVEGVRPNLTKEDQLRILTTLNDAEAFEKFLSTRYIGQKRFGLEGAESAIVFLTEVLNQGVRASITSAILGMAHRGRLNVLANIVGKSYRMIFEEFEGNLDPTSVQGSGDVKYHKGFEGTYYTPDGTAVPITLASNPSHLEAVDGVVEGMVRASQDLRGNLFEFAVLGILVHGDASFAGQGVVAETLNLSQLPGYRTGGTVHLVINNQVGFTTNPNESRSSVYASDIAKMIQAPIIHVNGDDPEAVLRAAQIAMDYREAFHKDIVVDMVCYRRHGHNEGDEPSYTQPVMYRVIDSQPSVRKLYLERLVRSKAITVEEGEQALDAYLARLQQALVETREAAPPKPTDLPAPPPQNVAVQTVQTGIAKERLDYVVDVLNRTPAGFTLHPKLAKQFQTRAELYAEGEVDWALGEAFAFATVMLDGHDVRLSGQDSRRGTFSHRHAALYDYETGATYQPLAAIRDDAGAPTDGVVPGRFMIYDSSLSEYAAMAFEYGYSLIQKKALTIWEAQFGDFANGAQVVIDQFIAAAHDKWRQESGLTLMLPHGYEGQGPEHSSARLERFLSLAAGPNMTIANPTNAAQLFHLLRAQVERTSQRPLIILTPKSLLRAKQSRSPVEAFTNGSFQPLLDDPQWAHDQAGRFNVRRVVLCSGKIGYEALAQRDRTTSVPTAVVRVEQLYPWPEREITELIESYPSATELVWLQEEPENMGAWPFAHARLHRSGAHRLQLVHVSRVATGSPATGSAAMHALEQSDILERAVSKPLN